MKHLAGQIAVVTGSCSGIGPAITLKLIEKGVNVVGIARTDNKHKEIDAEIAKHHELYTGKFYHLKCDMTHENEVKEVLKWIESHVGIPSILVSNAGVWGIVPFSEYDSKFVSTVRSPFLCALEVIKAMIKKSIHGHIIVVNSISDGHHEDNSSDYIYTASKIAVTAFAKAFQAEFAKNGISVSTISTGHVKTETTSEKLLETEILDPTDVAHACVAVLDHKHDYSMQITLEPLEAFSHGDEHGHHQSDEHGHEDHDHQHDQKSKSGKH